MARSWSGARCGTLHASISACRWIWTAVFSVALPSERYHDPVRVAQFFDYLQRRLASIPGVLQVGITSRAPFNGGTNGDVSTAESPSRTTLAEWRAVSPGFFGALGLRVTAGRGFAGPPSQDAEAVIFSAALARALFGGGDAIGERIRMDGRNLTVVGVVTDFRDFGPTRDPRPTVYLRHGSSPGFASSGSMIALARGTLPAAAILPAARDILRELDPAVPIDRFTTLADQAERAQGVSRLAAGSLLTLFTAIAVALAVIGIAGVIAFDVERRTRDIGVRLALGSTPRAIVRRVLLEGGALTLAGGLLGVTGAWWMDRLVADLTVGWARPAPAGTGRLRRGRSGRGDGHGLRHPGGARRPGVDRRGASRGVAPRSAEDLHP